MNIKIGNLMITSFCSENIEHLKFRNDLKEDEAIYDYVSTNIEYDLQEIDNQEEINLEEASYIIAEKDKLVGYVYLDIVEAGVVELRYAVHPEYRRLGYLGYSDSNRKGYGQQILEECRDYLFTLKDINSIELHIRKDNEASIGCAKKAKYKCIGENANEYYYIYRNFKENNS